MEDRDGRRKGQRGKVRDRRICRRGDYFWPSLLPPSFLPSTAVDMDWRDRVGGGVVIMIRGITLLGRLAVD